MATAIGLARPGGALGYVGVLHSSSHNFNLSRLFRNNITLRGGVAPARARICSAVTDLQRPTTAALRHHKKFYWSHTAGG